MNTNSNVTIDIFNGHCSGGMKPDYRFGSIFSAFVSQHSSRITCLLKMAYRHFEYGRFAYLVIGVGRSQVLRPEVHMTAQT